MHAFIIRSNFYMMRRAQFLAEREGFGAMMHSGMPMNPQHSVSQSACILSFGAKIKNTTREQYKGCEIDFTRLWCCNKVGSECTQLGAGLLEEQWSMQSNYQSCYIERGVWHVVYNIDHFNNNTKCIPVF